MRRCRVLKVASQQFFLICHYDMKQVNFVGISETRASPKQRFYGFSFYIQRVWALFARLSLLRHFFTLDKMTQGPRGGTCTYPLFSELWVCSGQWGVTEVWCWDWQGVGAHGNGVDGVRGLFSSTEDFPCQKSLWSDRSGWCHWKIVIIEHGFLGTGGVSAEIWWVCCHQLG